MKRPSPTMNNKQGHQFTSYQQGVYYASDQTNTLHDTTKTMYETDEAASNVLHKMTAQRQQIEGAHENVWEMRKTTETAKREIQELQSKYLRKKARLYAMIVVLGVTDLLLFFRIIQCHGNFYCL
jgi:predicted  nucleic acid-binding Zn-ribbon protein